MGRADYQQRSASSVCGFVQAGAAWQPGDSALLARAVPLEAARGGRSSGQEQSATARSRVGRRTDCDSALLALRCPPAGVSALSSALMKRFSLLLLLLAACATAKPVAPGVAKPAAPEGFIPFQWDAGSGKLMLQISHFGEDLLYVTSLPGGVGSNPIGLDRNEMGDTHLVHFERIGPKVLLVETNPRFRALSNDPNERRAVDDSFARSVLWGFKVEKSDGDQVTIDATDFFLSDMHGVASRLRATQQGSYSVDRNRSAIYLPRTKSFPKNTEVEATLTFETKDRPGSLVSGVTPDPQIVTL